jgi:hypothetical protein
VDWKLFAQLVVTFLVAAVGWWAAHIFTSRRDAASERRKQRLAYLLEAYRRLESCASPHDPSAIWPAFESAIADIQLLGTAKQVALAQQVARTVAENPDQGASLNELLANIRMSLRAELQLEPVELQPVIVRFRRDHGQK